MALTEYEERVIAELETQLRPDDSRPRDLLPGDSVLGDSVFDDARLDDSVWLRRFEALAVDGPRSIVSRLAPLLACLLGGAALLVAARHTWFLVGTSNVSGFSSSSITRALGVVGCAMVVGSALMLRRMVGDLRHHPR
jgi:hypothetical protein